MTKNNQLKQRWNWPDIPSKKKEEKKMEIKLIQKINLRKDGNRRTPPPKDGN